MRLLPKRRWLLLIALGLAVALTMLSRMRADRYTPGIQAAIEAGLGRTVEIHGPVTFSPLRLGFSLGEVVIHAEDRFGPEPVAYVADLQASVRLFALLRGRLEFSELRLVEPSVNLIQGADGWNFPSLLRQTLGANREPGRSVPAVTISGGRLNFRFGEWKSEYYLADADLTLEPTADPETLSVYFDGVPTRTDRAALGFGRLSGRGSLHLGERRELNLQLALNRSAISDLLMLVRGRGSGINGFLTARASLQGPLDNVNVSGRVQLEELERFEWLGGASGGPAVNWVGRADLYAESLELHTSGAGLPVSLDVRAENMLKRPRWTFLASLRDAPAADVQQLAAELGFVLPAGARVEGVLNGAVGYEAETGLDGEVGLKDASVTLATGERARVENASVQFADGLLKLAPTPAQLDGGAGAGAEAQASLEGAYDLATGSLAWLLTGSDVPIQTARSWGVPLPAALRGGHWKGSLSYKSEGEEVTWSGRGDLRDAQLSIDGVAGDVQLARAAVRLQSGRFSLTGMEGTLDGVEFAGDFEHNALDGRPNRLRVRLGEISVGELGRWLAPALRREGGFLARAFRRGGAAPPWLAARNVDVAFEARAVHWGETSLEPVSCRVQWTGGDLRITDIVARGGGGRVLAQASARLGENRQGYESVVHVEDFGWRGGEVDGDMTLVIGNGAARGSGVFRAREAVLFEGVAWPYLSGAWEFDWRDGEWDWKLSQVMAKTDSESGARTLLGHGSSLPDGRLQLELTDAGEPLRMAGNILDGFWQTLR